MYRTLATLAALAALAASSADAGFVVVQSTAPAAGRAAFNALLTGNAASRVVDTAGAFAPDPAAGLYSVVTRSGNVAGQSFSYAAYDINFSNAPTGTLTPGSAGGDIFSTSTVTVERPAEQDGAVGAGSWGLDSLGATDSGTTRNAALFNFTSTPGGRGIGHFAADLIDWEAFSLGRPGELRLYDNGSLVFSRQFQWDPLTGNAQRNFLGVAATDTASFFDQVVIVLGDDDAAGRGFTERWAADRFSFGRAYAIPEPSSLAMLGFGAMGLLGYARRRKTRMNA